ncbi:transposase [Streptomyces sp. NPDC002870]|uniref:transposase n=1 Tax=Streptomyces sp. NPDC002870 TaxID=3364666 RepID=UPI0036A4CF64
MVRAELTDEEWELIEPFLPIGRFGPYLERLRQQFEGIVWRFRTGSPWRDMLTEHGAWQTVDHRFLQWRDACVFEQLMDGMITEAARRVQKKGRRGGRPVSHDAQLYRDRNSVERCINKIMAWRGLAGPFP